MWACTADGIRRIHNFDIVRLLQEIEWDGIGGTLARDFGDFVLEVANVIKVNRSDYRNPGVEKLLDVLPSLLLTAARRILVSQPVDDDDLRMPAQ